MSMSNLDINNLGEFNGYVSIRESSYDDKNKKIKIKEYKNLSEEQSKLYDDAKWSAKDSYISKVVYVILGTISLVVIIVAYGISYWFMPNKTAVNKCFGYILLIWIIWVIFSYYKIYTFEQEAIMLNNKVKNEIPYTVSYESLN
jgi:hypothetical protein